MKRKLLSLCMLFFAIALWAQDKNLTGVIYDNDSKETVIQATVQLLKTDSTYVTGSVTDIDGRFTMQVPSSGTYLVKMTCVGYLPQVKKVTIGDDADTDLGKIALKADAIMLKGAVVEGHAAKVVVHEDTFQYNASAYRVPEGSTIEALVKKLPGAEVGDDGTIKINGKQVKKILVDGKEFMTGDTQTAMKNLPSSIVDKVKAYDQQSDLARITGIDDGDEQTVLDFGIKRGMNKGQMVNVTAGIGTEGRYSERLMGGYFTDKMKIMVMGNANNVNDAGFGGGRGFSAPKMGLNASKMLGVNMNYDDGNKLQMDGSLRWNHSDGDTRSEVATENFVSTLGSFSNSLSQAYNRSNSWDFRYRLEWTPDSMTNVMFRPNFRVSTSDGINISSSASYNENPYDYTDSPLEEEAIKQMAAQGIMVNTNQSGTINYGDNKSLGAMLQYNRKLNQKGRNVTLRADVSWGKNASTNLSTQNVHLYQVLNQQGTDSLYSINRYNLTPTRNWSYALQATYSEPLATKTYLQFSYQYKRNFSKSDRSTYDFSNINSAALSGLTPAYRAWDQYLSLLPDPLDTYLDTDLSRYSEYTNYIHELQVMLRVVRDKYRLNAGVMVQPQRTEYTQDYLGIHTDTVRNVINWSPTFDLRYRFNKQSNLRINYRGTTSQPSMGDLLDIVDDSNPLNIKKGNPGLKPSFTHRMRLFYNNYIQSHQQGIMAFLNYSNTLNSISNKVTYDEKTGGRTTQPENINGNWSVDGAFMYNCAIDSAGYFNINTFTNANYNNYVSYLTLDRNADAQKNVTRSTTLGERLSASYRNLWLEVELDGSLNYTHTANKLQAANNLNTWQFTYGGSVNLTLPWNMSISTDLHQQSRRGYDDSSLNTNELVWNAQISQSLLKGNALTLAVQFYDILGELTSFSRAISATQRTDTQYNSINSYVMFTASYRLNLFGGKEARRQRGDGPGFNREGPGMGPRNGIPSGPPPTGGGFRGGGGGFGGPMMVD